VIDEKTFDVYFRKKNLQNKVYFESFRKGKFMDDYWIPGQRMMGDIKFLDSLRAFDKDNVPQHIMEKIRIKYINMELFDPNNVKKVR